jgi:Ca2+-binding RTX toxin-like protein
LIGGAGFDSFIFYAVSESTTNSRDLIMDFTNGEDEILVGGLGFTGVTAGAALQTELKVLYSVASDTTIISNAATGFALGLHGNHVAELDATDFSF